MAKKSSMRKATPTQPQWLPLLIAGAVGFAGAFLFLKGCPFSRMSCPVYSDICPVTATFGKVEKSLSAGDLPAARKGGEKLADLLSRSMPELSQSAKRISESQTLDQARAAAGDFQKQMESTSRPGSSPR